MRTPFYITITLFRSGPGTSSTLPAKAVTDVQKPLARQFIATVDLDRAFAHHDFNRQRVEKMLKEHKGQITVERNLSDDDLAPWWLFKAVKPGVRVRELMKEHKIETLREYQHRCRRQINAARAEGKRV